MTTSVNPAGQMTTVTNRAPGAGQMAKASDSGRWPARQARPGAWNPLVRNVSCWNQKAFWAGNRCRARVTSGGTRPSS